MIDHIDNRGILALVQELRWRFGTALLRNACALVSLLLVVGIAAPAHAQSLVQASKGDALQAPVSARNQAIQALSAMPLTFEKNMGQVDDRVSFLSRMSDYTLFLTGTDSVLVHSGKIKDSAAALRMRWLGASSTVTPEGDEQVSGKSNYLIGNDSSRWHSNVPNYQRVKENSLYPGIDLAYYGSHQQLEYDLTVAPGVDPGVIRLQIEGARKLRIDKATGDLVIRDQVGSELRFRKPVVYQADQGGKEKRFVPGNYALSARNVVSFVLAEYDHGKPLVIDPYVVYSTMFGGANKGNGYTASNQYTGMAVDSSGDVYLAGTTTAVNLPTTTGAYQTFCNAFSSSQCANFFVAKFDPTQSGAASLVYATYVGGHTSQVFSGPDTNAYAPFSNLAVDGSGDAYFTGWVNAAGGSGIPNDYPMGANTYTTYASGCTSSYGCGGAFGVVTKLDPTGSTLLYSTYFLINVAYYLGGGVSPGMITVDGAQVAYIAGMANLGLTTTDGSNIASSANFVAAFDTTKSGSSSLVYSEYLPVSIYAIAADVSGNLYVGGAYSGITPFGQNTQSLTLNGFQPSATSGWGGVLVRLNHAGLNTYATYIGSIQAYSADGIFAVSVDANGVAYVGGAVNAPVAQLNGLTSTSSFSNLGPFIAKIDTTQTGSNSLRYSTFVAPDAGAFVYGVSNNAAGLVAFTGAADENSCATASNYTQVNPITQPFPVPKMAACPYVAVIDTTQSGNSALTFLSFLDGVQSPFGVVLQTTTPTLGNLGAVGPQSNTLYVGGTSVNMPTASPFLAVAGSYETAVGYQNNPPFFYKISMASPPELTVSPTLLVFGSQVVNTTSSSQPVTVTNIGSSAITFTGIVASSQFIETDNCLPSLAGGSSCTVNVSFQPTAIAPAPGTLTLTDSDSSSPQSVVLSGTGTAPASQTISFTNPGTQTYGTPLVLSATATSGLPVGYAVSGPATLSSSTLTFTGIGSVTVLATQTGNAFYAAATPVSQTFSVSLPPPISLSIAEHLHLADTPTQNPSTLLSIAETIRITDSPSVPIPTKIVPTVAFTGAPASAPYHTTFTVLATTNASTAAVITASGACTIAGTTVTITSSTGTCKLKAAWAADANYLAAAATQSTTATGIPPYLSTSTLAFGNEGLGVTSAPRTVYVYNYSGSPVNAQIPVSTGAFTVAGGAACASLATNATCNFAVTFTAPGTPGAVPSTPLNVVVGATTLPLMATGTAVQPLYLSTSTLAFGNEGLGVTSAPRTVYVYNYSGSPVNAQIPVSTGAFTVAGGAACASLATNATCNFAVTFTAPGTPGAVPSTPLNVVVGATTLPLMATGTAVQPLYLSTSTLAFGNEGLGVTSAPRTVYVYNYSGSPVNAQIPVSTGAFTVAGGAACASLATNATCNFAVTFTAPGTPGAVPSTPLNVVVGATTLPLMATGTAVQPLYLSTSTLAFGNEGLGVTSAPRTVYVYNYSGSPVNAQIPVSTGAFTVAGGAACASLATNATCNFAVTFTAPGTPGAVPSTPLNVVVGATTLPLMATGTAVQPLYLSTSTLAFGNEGLGVTSAPRTVYVYNYSGSPVNAQIPVSTGAFTVAGGAACASLATNATCNFAVTFTAPGTPGAVPSTPLNVVVGATTLPLMATGTAVQPLYLSTSTLAFGNEGLGVTSAPRTVYVYNYSGSPVNAQIPVSTGAFTVAGGAACASLATNATCNFAVTFTAPGTPGAVPSTPLNVVVGATTLPLMATGTAVQPLYLSTSTLAFGNEGLGVTSAPRTVYVYNYSGSPVNAQIPVSTGAFTVAGGAACASLATNATCNFAVTFTAPGTPGAVPSTPLNVVVGATTLPLMATGTAVQPLYLSTSTLAFGNEGLGVTSAPRTVYVYNYSGSPVNAQIPVSTGAFTVAGGAACASLATNATCNFAVTFTAPGTPGAVPSTPLNVVVGATTLPLMATGTAVQPLYLSTSTLAFGNEGLGVTSAPRTVYVYNYSGSPVNAQIPVSTGAFTVAGGAACASLATNATCNFAVTFTAPGTPGAVPSTPLNVVVGATTLPLMATGTAVQPLYLSTSTLAFGNEGLGVTSAPRTVYVYNYSGSPVNAQIPVSTGAFTVAGGAACASLATNATCNFAVTFTAPGTPGAVPSTPLNVVVGATTLPLMATGTAVQPLYLSTSTLAFGNEGLGVTSAPRTVYVYNYSGSPVNAQIPVSTGAFTVAGGAACASLATNATCNFAVTFTAPGTPGAVPSTPLNVVVGATTLPLMATGTAVQPLYLSTSTLAFGNEGLGVTSAPRTVYVYNYSGSPVNAQIPVSTGAFTVAGGAACASLATNATCNFAVTFTAPGTPGAVPSTPLNVVVGATTLPLMATGTAVQPLYLSTSTLAFGNEGLGVTSAPRTVYVYNYSGSPVNAQIPVSTGAFTVAGGAACASLATNATCNFAVTFTAPGTPGAVPSTPLNVVVGATTLPLMATGTAVQPLYLSTSTLAFGNEGLGVTSAPRTVYVYNYSGSPVNAQIPVSTGAFTVAGGAACASLATNATCNFAVTFTAPGTPGAVPSTPLNVVVGATTLPLMATGTAVQPLYLSTSTLAFGNEGLGVTSAPRTVYVYNYSGSPVNAQIPVSTGAFTVAGGAACASLATNATCNFAVTFTAPGTPGAVPSTPLNVVVGATTLPLMATGTGK